MICLECSGQHRALGVHRSFVRSVTLDTWSESEIRTMQLGGNEKLHSFLGDVEGTSIAQRYTTSRAELYRQRLAALRDGAKQAL